MDIRSIGDELEPRLKRTFMEAVDAAANLVSVEELTTILTTGTMAELEALGDRLVVGGFVASADEFVSTLRTVAQAAALTTISIGASLDRISQRSLDFIRNHGLGLITGLTTDMREVVRDVLHSGYIEGIGAPAMARQIRNSIGLLPTHADAVKRYHDSMVLSEVKPELVEKNTATYARRLLAWRADMIARTETMAAAHSGLVAGWGANMVEGLIPARSLMKWVVTEDDRLCERCAPMDGVTQFVGKMFETSIKGFPEGMPEEHSKKKRRLTGPRPGSKRNKLREEDLDGRVVPLGKRIRVLHPPLHPACRCSLVLVIPPPPAELMTSRVEVYQSPDGQYHYQARPVGMKDARLSRTLCMRDPSTMSRRAWFDLGDPRGQVHYERACPICASFLAF